MQFGQTTSSVNFQVGIIEYGIIMEDLVWISGNQGHLHGGCFYDL